jgi:hypothetical protein
MKNERYRLGLILLTIGFSVYAGSATQRRDQKQPMRCTKEALAALKAIPNLRYRCGEDPDEELEKSPRRRAALRAYSKKLELGATPNWWATSLDDLNACAISHEARALTDAEQRDPVADGAHDEIFGDGSTRLLVLPDPCIKYSAVTFNAFVLQRADGRVYATQVLDAFFTRLEPGVEMELARHNGETLVIVQTNSEPTPSALFSTFRTYAIDPQTHRAVPRKIFMDKGKLTNEFQFDEYLFGDQDAQKRWHAPELIHNGALSPRFYVYTLIGSQDQVVEAEAKFSRKAYVWNGRYYAPK